MTALRVSLVLLLLGSVVACAGSSDDGGSGI